MLNNSENVSIAFCAEIIRDIIGYLKELEKFLIYENTIYNPFYNAVDVYLLRDKIKYFEDLLKNNEINFVPGDTELEFEQCERK